MTQWRQKQKELEGTRSCHFCVEWCSRNVLEQLWTTSDFWSKHAGTCFSFNHSFPKGPEFEVNNSKTWTTHLRVAESCQYFYQSPFQVLITFLWIGPSKVRFKNQQLQIISVKGLRIEMEVLVFLKRKLVLSKLKPLFLFISTSHASRTCSGIKNKTDKLVRFRIHLGPSILVSQMTCVFSWHKKTERAPFLFTALFWLALDRQVALNTSLPERSLHQGHHRAKQLFHEPLHVFLHLYLARLLSGVILWGDGKISVD